MGALILQFSKLESLQFTRGRFGNFGKKVNPSWPLVAAYFLSNQFLEFLGQLLAGRELRA